jgi:hypothetical protein
MRRRLEQLDKIVVASANKGGSTFGASRAIAVHSSIASSEFPYGSRKARRNDRVTGAARYPRLIAASGRCPPEDVGGPWGYEEFLEAIANPVHERHQEMVEWWGEEGFEPTVLDIASIEERLTELGRRWTPRPRAKSRGKSQ